MMHDEYRRAKVLLATRENSVERFRHARFPARVAAGHSIIRGGIALLHFITGTRSAGNAYPPSVKRVIPIAHVHGPYTNNSELCQWAIRGSDDLTLSPDIRRHKTCSIRWWIARVCLPRSSPLTGIIAIPLNRRPAILRASRALTLLIPHSTFRPPRAE